jgi:hypothetical protein
VPDADQPVDRGLPRTTGLMRPLRHPDERHR